MNPSDIQIVTAKEVEAVSLDRFLRSCFNAKKCSFLRDHGDWHHRGNEHRLVARTGDRIVAYCAVIPTRVTVLEREMLACWWVDLFVDPAFRGQGIQRSFDRIVSQTSELQLGIPNHLAAKVHRRHGWGVRDDFRMMLLPLVPAQVLRVRERSGAVGIALKSAARLVDPIAGFLRRRLARHEPVAARRIADPEPDFLASICRPQQDGWLSTTRSADFFHWRYFESPHRSQYTFFIGGAGDGATLVAVCRTFARRGVTVTRILELFGDLRDRGGLADLLRVVAQESLRRGAVQVTAKGTNACVSAALRAAGFVLSMRSRFCWRSADPVVMQALAGANCHWTLADSDSDTPD